MYGDGEREVIGHGRRGTKVEDPEMRVRGYGGEDGRGVRGVRRAVGAGVGGEGKERIAAVRRPLEEERIALAKLIGPRACAENRGRRRLAGNVRS